MNYVMLFTISFPNIFSLKCSKLIVQQKNYNKNLEILLYQNYIKEKKEGKILIKLVMNLVTFDWKTQPSWWTQKRPP